ncbi:MAG: ribosome maturation factor RimM [Oscillospiraceae bacterium]|nr:ribosome maturation factor RimM [Oscillospiraceae bacterium]
MRQWLEAGRVAAAHGVRGEVRLRVFCDDAAFLLPVPRYKAHDGRELTVEGARPHKGALLVKFAGIDSRAAALALKGATLSFRRSDAALPEGRHYICDLVGMDVYNADGERLGFVAEVLKLPAHDVYRVAGGSRERLIPASGPFVRNVDIEAGRMDVALIEGM